MIKFSKLLLAGFLIAGINYSCENDVLEDEGDARDVFVGTWSVSETSKLNSPRNYDVVIEKGFGSRINMFNFYLVGNTDSIYGTVSTVATSTVTIPIQTLAGNEFQGDGKLINDDKITFEFIVDDGNETDTISSIFTR